MLMLLLMLIRVIAARSSQLSGRLIAKAMLVMLLMVMAAGVRMLLLHRCRTRTLSWSYRYRTRRPVCPVHRHQNGLPLLLMLIRLVMWLVRMHL